MVISKDKKERYVRLLLYSYSILITLIFIYQLTIMYSPLVNNLAENLITGSGMRKADVIVVLSSGAFNDGTLGHSTLVRTLRGIELYKNGLANKVIFCGGNLPKNKLDISISQKMADIASLSGIPQDAQIVEDVSVNTHQNALQVKKIMNRYVFKDALLVTSAIHMKRAMLTFEKAGIKVYPASVSAFETVITDPLDRFGMFREVMREYVGLLYYKWKGRI